jgi:hypothetical protein
MLTFRNSRRLRLPTVRHPHPDRHPPSATNRPVTSTTTITDSGRSLTPVSPTPSSPLRRAPAPTSKLQTQNITGRCAHDFVASAYATNTPPEEARAVPPRTCISDAGTESDPSIGRADCSHQRRSPDRPKPSAPTTNIRAPRELARFRPAAEAPDTGSAGSYLRRSA